MNTKYMFSSVTIIGIISLSPIIRAQTYQPTNRIPVADNSRIGTQVSGTNNNFAITGGVKLGQRLFHSFQDFSVPTNGAVTFFNPVGNQSIITRVTGSSFSDINGVVNTQGANFLLINPNGIVFGTNAQLNVGRAFLGSTANGIDLADAGRATINFGTNRNGDDRLLTINPNALFNISRLNMGGGNGQISNFGTLQTNNPNQYIGLIGGNITMNGGKIIAPGGRVELGGMSVAGTVTLGIDGNASRVQFPADLAYADVLMTNQAGVSVSGAGAGAGDISINARNVEMSEGSVFRGGIETGLGAPGVVAGDIKVNATNSLMLSNSGIINLVNSNSQGNGGNVTIDAGSVSLREGARLSASTFGNGNAGSVKVKAKNAVSLMSGQTAIFSTVEPGGVGKGGNIDITAASLSIQDGAQVQTLTRKSLDNIQLAGKGNAGNITVKVTGAVDFVGTKNDIASGIVSSVGVGTEGNAGNITVDAGSLSLRNGAKLSALTSGQGNAGNVAVKVTNAIKLEGKEEGSVSQIRTFVDTGAVGDGGNITIETGSLSLRDGSQILASTFGKGDAGNVTVKAKDAVSLTSGQTTIFSTVEAGGVGKGGNIKIDAGSLSLQDGAQLLTDIREASTTDPAGKGDAGNVTVKVTGAVDIAGKQNGLGSSISSSVRTGAVGKGGDIKIDSGSLSLRNGGELAALTRGQGNGGSVTVDTGSFFLRDGAQVTASTFGKGNAGSVKITSKDTITLSGAAIFSTIEAGGEGKGGNIDITATSLLLQNGAQLQTFTSQANGNQPAGKGNAGNVTVKVTGAVDIVGTKNDVASGIISSVEKGTVGNAGDIKIDAGSLSLRNGGKVSATTSGQGNAGNINVKVTESVKFGGIEEGSVSQLWSIVKAGAVGNGGNITLEAGSLSLQDGAQILASTSGKGDAGNVTVKAKDAVSLTSEQTTIFSTVEAGGVGKGGNIKIDAGSLSLQDGAQLLTGIREASTTDPAGKGDAGNVTVKVTGAVDIAGKQNGLGSSISSSVRTGAVGKGGDIKIDSGSLSLRNGGELAALIRGQGNGGSITVDTGSFSLRDGAQITVSTFGNGNAGSVKVNAKDAVTLSGAAIFSTIEAGGKGQGGNIDIKAASLSLQDGAQLQTFTNQANGNQPAGKGNAGNVTVKVTGAVDIVGTKNGVASGIISSVKRGTVGNGGNITIDTGSFSLRDGTRLQAITEGQGNAGTIIVNATDFVTIAGKTEQFFSGLFATSLSPTGTAGDIFVTSPKITLDRGILESVSLSGNGGNIQIGGKLPTQSTAIQGSQINPAETKLLSLRRGAQISTNASGTAQQGSNGGNITITAPNGFIVTAPNENSDISANGFSGSGGKVNIDTRQNFWISPLSRAEVEKRLGTTEPSGLNPAFLSTNDITAISQVNPNLSGQVSITPPQIDITAGLSPLPNNVTDPTNQINPNCSAKAIANNSFTSVGRGGIPATPKDPLNEQEIATNWVRLNPQNTLPSTPIAATPASPQPIVEAQGWRRERNGDIVLVAGSSLRTLPRQGQSPSGCVGQ
jgi:filamentous hemagglutinin family protein